MNQLSRFASLVLLASSMATLTPAQSQPPTTPSPEAQEAARQGTEKFFKGEFALALADFDTALAGGVVDGRLLFQTGFSQRMTGKPLDVVRQTLSRAIGALDGPVNRNPEQGKIIDWAYMAMAYAGVGDRTTSRQTAVGGMRAYREGRFGGVATLPALEAYYLGRLATIASDPSLQRNAFERTLKAGENWAATHPDLLARALADLGQLDLTDGQFETARGHLEQALELAPGDRLSGARFNLAIAYYRLGRYQEAELAWDASRLEDPVREPQAGYGRQLMRTLDKIPLLLDETDPLADLAPYNQADLEMRLLNLAAQIGDVAAKLPPEAVQNGYLTQVPSDNRSALRVHLSQLRDLKVRSAWVAAEYVARGLPIREFAFQNGLQAVLRPWGRLPKEREQGSRQKVDPAELPEYLLENPETLEAAKAKRKEAIRARRDEREQNGQPRKKRKKKQSE